MLIPAGACAIDLSVKVILDLHGNIVPSLAYRVFRQCSQFRTSGRGDEGQEAVGQVWREQFAGIAGPQLLVTEIVILPPMEIGQRHAPQLRERNGVGADFFCHGKHRLRDEEAEQVAARP